jgi:hypothetical protein
MVADPLPLAGLTVLVAEAATCLADELAQLVRELGGTVAGPAGAAAEAGELASRERLDLALLAVELCDGGASLAAILAARSVPLVLLGDPGGPGLEGNPTLQAVPRLAKPFGFDAFQAAICAALRANAPSPCGSDGGLPPNAGCMLEGEIEPCPSAAAPTSNTPPCRWPSVPTGSAGSCSSPRARPVAG